MASNNKDIDLFKTSVEDVAKRQEALAASQQKLAGYVYHINKTDYQI